MFLKLEHDIHAQKSAKDDDEIANCCTYSMTMTKSFKAPRF